MRNLGKVRNFRAVTMINCKKQLPNLGEDHFFRDHHDFFEMTKFSWFDNLRQFFCPIRNVLENHDLGKRHKI